MNAVPAPPAASPDTVAPLSRWCGSLPAGEWHDLLGKFEDACIYQTHAYGAVHWSESQLSHLVLRRQGNVVAAAQLRIVQVPLLRKGIAYMRAGPVCRLKGAPFDPSIWHATGRALKEEYVEHRGLMLRVIPPCFQSDPLIAQFQSSWASLGFQQVPGAPYRTIRLDLQKPVETLRKGLGAKWRNKLNGAERNGLSIVEGVGTDLYDRFLAAYRQMMSRKSFETSVDVDEFRAIHAALPDPLKMRTFLCEKDGVVLNALVVTAIGDTAIYILGATSDEGLKLKGAYLLQWRAIQWLRERGCRWYDLGGINPDTNPGVYEFKSGFGGEEAFGLGTFELSAGWGGDLVKGMERLQKAVQTIRAR